MSDIPASSREAVEERDFYLCVRCAHRGGDWHHRRTRAVSDRHQHCPCNGVLLCRTCHKWVHSRPDIAKDEGLIVSRYNEAPYMVPIHSFMGWFTAGCDGTAVFHLEKSVKNDDGIPHVLPLLDSKRPQVVE